MPGSDEQRPAPLSSEDNPPCNCGHLYRQHGGDGYFPATVCEVCGCDDWFRQAYWHPGDPVRPYEAPVGTDSARAEAAAWDTSYNRLEVEAFKRGAEWARAEERGALETSRVLESSARNAMYGMTRAFAKERKAKVIAESSLAEERAARASLEAALRELRDYFIRRGLPQ